MPNLDARRPLVPERLVGTLKSSMQSCGTLLVADAAIVFLCGARPTAKGDGARDQLVRYARRHLKGFRFFMAEDVFNAADPSGRYDLLTVENFIADFADCIIMVLETPSVFAELGAFTVQDKLVKKLLVINDTAFKNCPSFISRGPLAIVDTRSRFKPVLYADLRTVLSAAKEIESRLDCIRRTYNQRVDMSSPLERIAPKHRILLLCDLVWIFAPVRLVDLVEILKQLFGEVTIDVKLHLELLQGLGLLTRLGDYYFPILRQLFFRYIDVQSNALRAAAVDHYQKHAPSRVHAMAIHAHVA